jgi:hypothetical protein
MKRALFAAGWAAVAAGILLPFFALAASAQETHPPTRRERRQARMAARKQDGEEWRAAWAKLSLEDRATLATAWRNAVETMQNLTPAQKERLRTAAQNVGDQLRELTPEQRQRLQERLERAAIEYSELTPEQKEKMLASLADTIERLRDLTPEQREKLRALYRRFLGL